VTSSVVTAIGESAVLLKKLFAPPTGEAEDRQLRLFGDFAKENLLDNEDGRRIWEDWAEEKTLEEVLTPDESDCLLHVLLPGLCREGANKERLIGLSRVVFFGSWHLDLTWLLAGYAPLLTVEVVHPFLYWQTAGMRGRLGRPASRLLNPSSPSGFFW